MKISYFEFKGRLIRGGYECTKTQLEGLYGRYMSGNEPVWVSDCINPKPIKPFLAIVRPTVAEPVVECVRINPRIVCEERILAALAERDMFASELAKLIDRCVTYARFVLRAMIRAGRVLVTTKTVSIKTKRGDQAAHKNCYSLAKKERAA